ncbi:hypothetical protein HMJ29_15095 [Hymenobacter taeanensis]|uniref:Uncharacterized protein n=1 Tax=Hymenobacter taeanensis TaxID=2735321 RepID=A0A6M6BJF8_9BACT|nr:MULTISPECIES: hypothetical protein [Hymenobacter]QJX48182.1 hypothetical protein HMJ29_15095 [Hymenobacter taeanensis]UOQ82345.1 hypothetical protein MUN83_06145 [Hymenobacter sp. 5414T-23]
MRKQLATAALLLAATIGVQAQQKPKPSLVQPQDKTKPSPRLNPVQERAKRLSDQMARDLRLNGYQSAKLRAINEDKVAKMAAIEQRNAGNQKVITEQCDAVCKERDKELQAVLSTDQYSNYYDSRATFRKYDRDYAARAADAIFVNSVQNPLPASSKGATIGPARTTAPATTTR